jgi:major membrane immunogen (membrane-anchored lipoprotein)
MHKGDKAEVQVNTNEGKIYSTYLCNNCQAKVKEMHSDDEFYEGDLKESESEE